MGIDRAGVDWDGVNGVDWDKAEGIDWDGINDANGVIVDTDGSSDGNEVIKETDEVIGAVDFNGLSASFNFSTGNVGETGVAVGGNVVELSDTQAADRNISL